MENETDEQGPNPIAFRLVWSLVFLVAIGCGWVVWGAYQEEVDRFLLVRMGPPSPELAAALPDGSQELIRRTAAGIDANYQVERKQPAVGIERPGPQPRVVWLGGSVVHGGSRGITREEEAAGRAGELLGVESLNFGGIGMDTVSIGAILDDVLSIEPDVLVLYTGHNEFGNAVFTGRYGDASTARMAMLRALLRKSRLLQSLEMWLRGPETLTLPSEANEKQYTVDATTRAEIYWRFEERLRHIVSEASGRGVAVVVATLMSNAVAPSMEFSCPEAMRRAGFKYSIPEALPVSSFTEADIVAAEAMSPGCRDLRWLRARRAGDIEMLDTLRDDDPLPARADRALNAVIRRVAADTPASLVDVDRMARTAGGGLEPPAWFLDSNHLTIDGHDALARMVGQVVAPLVELKPPALASAPSAERNLAGCCSEGCREQRDEFVGAPGVSFAGD